MYVVNTYMQQKMHTIMICTYIAYMHNALLLDALYVAYITVLYVLWIALSTYVF